MPVVRILVATTLLAVATACTPTLDWRDVRPEGSGATLLLPCKPSSLTRDVRLAGGSVRLTLHACSAGGATWALGFADVGDAARVAAALAELRAAAIANLGAGASQVLALAVPGATPYAGNTHVLISGHLPDGAAVQEQLAVFARGTLVFQATVLGAQLPADGVETFFTSLRLGS
jgi:hypothetical protein